MSRMSGAYEGWVLTHAPWEQGESESFTQFAKGGTVRRHERKMPFPGTEPSAPSIVGTLACMWPLN